MQEFAQDCHKRIKSIFGETWLATGGDQTHCRCSTALEHGNILQRPKLSSNYLVSKTNGYLHIIHQTLPP
jgi:hypothetical protein